MAGQGTKRASPGADEEKNPLAGVELSEEDAKKLTEVGKEIQRVELAVERESFKKLQPVYESRREILKSIGRFWPVALMNHALISLHATHNTDALALSYLEDLWIVRDPKEPRCFTLEFYFKENPFFSDSVLKKEFKYIAPPSAETDTPDADGITETMLEFSWERDVKGSATPINWKDAEKALTKLYPRVLDDEDDIAEAGSFFNFFEQETDPVEIALAIANEIFPEAIDYFLGRAGGDELDSDDEDDEDDDDDAEEIDLEKPRKKQKV